MHGRARRSLVVAASLGALSCSPGPTTAALSAFPVGPRTWRAPDAEQFERLRVGLAERRSARATAPWSAGIRVLMHEPRSGRTFGGRGGLAVAPSRAVRMILLGGAGSTVLDVWVSQQRWRVAIPALGTVRRGTTDAPDLPVGFLRWWFIDGLGGTLFAAEETAASQVWLLRTPGAVVELEALRCDASGLESPNGQGLLAERHAAGVSERVLECRAGARAAVGDVAEYENLGTGLQVRMQVESVSVMPPDDGAFLDPDSADALAGAP